MYRPGALSVFCMAVVFLSGCSSVQVISSAPPIAASSCHVKVHQSHVQALKGGAVNELCVISGTSSGSFSRAAAMAIEKDKNKACACGARDVYIESSAQSGIDHVTVTMVAFRYAQKHDAHPPEE